MPEIGQIMNTSVQTGEINQKPLQENAINLFTMLVRAGELVPPWWSRERDRYLREVAHTNDYVAGTINAVVSSLTTIPFSVLPYDNTIQRHVEMAKERQDNLLHLSHFYRGWNHLFAKVLQDFLTQDNGGFIEVIGNGPADGPIVGLPLGLAHLDASQCSRTSNPEYPVVYWNLKTGKRHKIHYTRIIDMVSCPSPDIDMNGVGMCGLSRVINVAQNLYDIAMYKQEKLGSRPERAIVYGNIPTESMQQAVNDSNLTRDAKGFSRFASYTFIGTNYGRDVKIDKLDLAGIPDGFDEKTSIDLGMYALALGFGIDIRDIWIAMQSGATKGDAAVTHLKARGKTKGEVLQIIERNFGQKFLPPYLYMKFDYQDDEEDALRADIDNVRSQADDRNTMNGIYTVRTVRERHMEAGAISSAQFEQMELEDGRLIDGTDISLLFYSDDPEIQPWIEGGEALLDGVGATDGNFEGARKTITQKVREVGKAYINQKHEGAKKKIRLALAAWKWLLTQYEEQIEEQQEMEQEEADREARMAPKPAAAAKPATKPGQKARNNRPTRVESPRQAATSTMLRHES